MAMRSAIILYYNNEKFPYTEIEGWSGKNGYDITFGIGAELAFEIHKDGGRIDPYYGVGGRFLRTTTKRADPISVPAGSTLEQPVLKNEIGGDAGMNYSAFFLLGMEYYITDNLSLASEYHFKFDYTAELTEGYERGPVTIETKGGSSNSFGITSSGFLTLAIYR